MSTVPQLDPREEHFHIAGDTDGLTLFLRYLPPAPAATALKIVLYIHGATFPSALSIAHRFDGYSWRDDLNAAGYHVWGLDFLGFGGSDRYPEMSESSDGIPALGRADIASRQIEKAVAFILKRHAAGRICLIAHSWGSMPAGMFAGRYPEQIDRIVLFAPIAQRPKRSSPKTFPGWRLVSLAEQWDRFVEDVPPRSVAVLSKRHFEEWAPMYLDTDEFSRTHSPESVKTPTGPVQEIAEAVAGHLAYDPGLIKAPTAIIRGEWDHLVTDDDARWLFGALKNSPIKRDIKISHATHLMHLERNRYALYRETQQFLDGGDQPSMALSEKCEANRTGTDTDSTSGDRK